jgi:hypothetical protein
MANATIKYENGRQLKCDEKNNEMRGAQIHFISKKLCFNKLGHLSVPMTDNMSLLSAHTDITRPDGLKIKLQEQHGLIVQSISHMDCSFERALSGCLSGNEDEARSISSTLHSQYEWQDQQIHIHTPGVGSMSIHRSTHDPLNQDQLYIILVSEIYESPSTFIQLIPSEFIRQTMIARLCI